MITTKFYILFHNVIIDFLSQYIVMPTMKLNSVKATTGATQMVKSKSMEVVKSVSGDLSEVCFLCLLLIEFNNFSHNNVFLGIIQ